MTTEPSFHHFPELPSEIRLKIWGYLLDIPRTVELKCKRGVLPGPRRYVEAWTSDCAIPPLLHVNREARYEALKIYEPYFGTKFSAIQTYIAFDRDMLKVPEGTLSYVEKKELDKIECLIMEVKDPSYFGHYNMDIIRHMPRLRELELLSGHGCTYSWDRSDGRYAEFLQDDFTEAKIQDPGWDSPRVRISSYTSGEEVAIIEGGAIEPGQPRQPGVMLADIVMGPLTWL